MAAFQIQTRLGSEHYRLDCQLAPKLGRHCVGMPVLAISRWSPLCGGLGVGLIWINARQDRLCPDADKERFLGGGAIPMQRQFNRPTIRTAILQAVALLMIFGLFLTTATAAIPIMADHPVAVISLSAAPSDCQTSGPSLGHTHCIGNAVAIAERKVLDVPLMPVAGPCVWHYAAVTSGPSPINQRLLRPPKAFRAPV